MRPPQNAGENGGSWAQCSRCWPSFNEAPAECGGKRWDDEDDLPRGRCFNEAPAECGGKPSAEAATARASAQLQ